MADSENEDAEVDGEEAKKKKKGMSGKKLILFVVLPVLLLVGGGAGAYFAGALDGLLGAEDTADAGEGEQHASAEAEGGHGAAPANENVSHGGGVVFYDLPEMLVNLNTGGKRTSYLKIRVSLELADEAAVPQIEHLLPRVLDNFQTYLRELRNEDLKGSGGLYRLKEELLIRVNTALKPVRINDVLFKEMLVQ
ncbi:flagellar basal body-associated FliL family protein [Oceanibacterium hippocampi]|uniref:Flagellar protein FliL n=1 Tax=Oceanibacterium hippocampi TaxID=745714 RepID=A0A1Y5TYQ1_9PROT|nr:flagellar basal body-associated FliL family protein [Oceanibacterium hippocampi]SLN77130.1 Flagellar FliL protein [Oceanibacterium hippocampi]